jgi:hypothetical protein
MISSQFREQVEAFITAHAFKPTEFGRQAVGDPSFVLNLRRGRSPTLTTADKVLSFMAEFERADWKRNRQRRSA